LTAALRTPAKEAGNKGEAIRPFLLARRTALHARIPTFHPLLGTNMTLKQRITDDMKSALRARETARLSAIRLLLAAVLQREVDERKEIADADVLAVIDKMVKQRKDAIVQFEAGNRKDLADAERAEIAVLQSYLPQPLSDAEIDAAIAAAVSRSGAAGPAAMGKVMAELKTEFAGRADMSAVSARVKARLAR
jgi:uncharacterized protein YqeY